MKKKLINYFEATVTSKDPLINKFNRNKVTTHTIHQVDYESVMIDKKMENGFMRGIYRYDEKPTEFDLLNSIDVSKYEDRWDLRSEYCLIKHNNAFYMATPSMKELDRRRDRRDSDCLGNAFYRAIPIKNEDEFYKRIINENDFALTIFISFEDGSSIDFTVRKDYSFKMIDRPLYYYNLDEIDYTEESDENLFGSAKKLKAKLKKCKTNEDIKKQLENLDLEKCKSRDKNYLKLIKYFDLS